MSPEIRPPVEFERLAFFFAFVIVLASGSYVAWTVMRGLGHFPEVVSGFVPLFGLSFILVGVGVVLRQKRLENIRNYAEFVSRMEQR